MRGKPRLLQALVLGKSRALMIDHQSVKKFKDQPFHASHLSAWPGHNKTAGACAPAVENLGGSVEAYAAAVFGASAAFFSSAALAC